ncbi:carbonic anhydrase 2-like isoform X3 [Dermacentor albipictus]|uniref:carbonic anhydrase 2-like isoform X3 n=1 Tax=Dermacentor albipictus TaxID=60249 RepID=UPI0038FCB466
MATRKEKVTTASRQLWLPFTSLLISVNICSAHYSPLAKIRGIQAPDNHNYFEPSTIVASLRKCDVDDWVYSVPSNCSISSSIHVFVSPTNSRVAVYGGPLLVEYTFVLGVFHFGTGSGQGAEHHIDEQNNAAELQLIHYTETNIDIDCLKEVNGLLALVILFKETENNNTALSGFLKAVRELHVPGTNETSPKASSAVPKFFMSYFTPASTENYYLYSGSLTFPPCTERVINVVLSRSVEIGKDQDCIFGTIHEPKEGKAITSARAVPS